MQWLVGKKTYLMAIAGGVVFVLAKLGIIDPTVSDWLFGLFGFGTVVSMRAGIAGK